MSVAPRFSVSPLQNDLLGTLSPAVQQRLFPLLELYPLSLGEILYQSGDTLSHAYFPTDAIISLLHVMEDGESAEVSIVGNDGFLGISRLMGANTTLWTSMVLCQGNSFRLPIRKLLAEFQQHDEVMTAVLRYAQALITQMAQTAACNRHHNLLQQLSRLLLLSLDRVSEATLDMTHERIASMLGVRREGVTVAAGKLQKLGLIRYGRGHIKVLDRTGLERLSCECYGVVQKETERLKRNKANLREPVQLSMGLR